MKMKKILIGVIVSLFFGACITEPDYSDIPAITFTDVQNSPSESQIRADSLTISLGFQDGDGDLGLESTDSLPPFGLFNADGTENEFFFNYFVTFEKKNNGNFELVTFPNTDTPVSLNGRFPPLNTLGRKVTLEGDLHYSFLVFYGGSFSPIQAGDTLRFKIKIADRTLNLSNEIETAEVIIGKH
jgi:hypothetical protein